MSSDREMEDVICTGSLFSPKGSRLIYINGEIDEQMACMFNLKLLSLEHENPDEDITVYINSPGGDVSAGLSMIDTMDIISCDVNTVCVGRAASMGAWILMCGTKGKRAALPHSTVLLHQPLAWMGGRGATQASDIKRFADEIMRLKEDMFGIVSERTGRTFEEVERDCDRDFIMTAAQALEYGVIDRVPSPHKKP
ncbi:MAG: ATP-dependent Clp protease proteolytic subunit [Sphaerochaetaceae bacterium]|nr:ATP-dependent Clp protease proteolytic subunit [Sphaerochaetaceae bacterium]